MQGAFHSWKCTEAAGVAIHRAVVQGTNAGECKYGASANVAGFVGFTDDAQGTVDRSVTLQEAGECFALAYGAVSVGDRCVIGDAAGRVASAESDIVAAPSGTAAQYEQVCIARTAAGQTDDVIRVLIAALLVKKAAT
jgi:hypothetical protein